MNQPIAKNGYTTRGFGPWALLFLIGLIGWLFFLLAGSDPARTWRALLISFIYAVPLAAGLVTWSAIVVAANGRWAGEAERLAWTGTGFLVPSFLVLICLWIGSRSWAPWYGNTELHQGLWLNNTFLFIREFAGLLVFRATAVWFLGQRSKGRQSAMMPAAVLIVVYCIVFTLFAFDFVMALLPEWRSGIFGAYFFISSLYLAMVFWTLIAVLHGSPVSVRHDLGKLVLAFSILTSSLLYMQLLTIWYENFPEETSYLIQRMHYPGWKAVSTFLVFIVYLGPLVMLLTEWSKKNRAFLGTVSVLLLIGLWIERWWMIAPTFSREIQFGLVEIAAAAAVLGLFGISITVAPYYLPQWPKEEDKALEIGRE